MTWQRALILLSVGGIMVAALGPLDLVWATAGAVLPVDTAITAIRTSVVNVWIPTIALLALALAGWNMATLGGLMAVATGWGLKVMLITRAAFTRGHVIKNTPARGREASHVVTPS